MWMSLPSRRVRTQARADVVAKCLAVFGHSLQPGIGMHVDVIAEPARAYAARRGKNTSSAMSMRTKRP